MGMRPPLYVRPLTGRERQQLEIGRRGRDLFTRQRCQILLASAAGQRPIQIAHSLGCVTQTVRNAIAAFHRQGLACLQAKSSRPKTAQPIFDPVKSEQLRAGLHTSPRALGHPRSLWSLHLAAEVCYQQGLTPERVSHETIRNALKRLGVNWRRAKHWITSPDPLYALKKNSGSG
jgi:transposase